MLNLWPWTELAEKKHRIEHLEKTLQSYIAHNASLRDRMKDLSDSVSKREDGLIWKSYEIKSQENKLFMTVSKAVMESGFLMFCGRKVLLIDAETGKPTNEFYSKIKGGK